MSEVDVQALVDGVAAELDAAVWLGDSEDRLLAHTAHDDVIDEVRRHAIMNRRLNEQERSWFEQWGVRDAGEPVHTPANPELGILERWCVPIRFRGLHLGYMWILGRREIEDDQLGPAVDAASHIASLLYRRRLVNKVDADLLRLLLMPTPEREAAAAEAHALGMYTSSGPVAVVVVGPRGGDELSSTALSDLALAVQRASEQAFPEPILAGMMSALGVLLAPLRKRNELGPAHQLAERVSRLATHVNHELEVVAAIGGATSLDGANRSYAEARRALRMVQSMPDLGPIATWNELGVFRALAFLPPGESESDVLDPRVRELLNDDGLAQTAEVFLDLAGDVQATAATLFVHRTTLYQRLDRIAVLYRLDLRRSGDHRLITHLGLKIARVVAP